MTQSPGWLRRTKLCFSFFLFFPEKIRVLLDKLVPRSTSRTMLRVRLFQYFLAKFTRMNDSRVTNNRGESW
jgi:hypothetical protein